MRFIGLFVVRGLDGADFFGRSLENLSPEHALLTDIREKSELFDQAATKYSPKVAS